MPTPLGGEHGSSHREVSQTLTVTSLLLERNRLVVDTNLLLINTGQQTPAQEEP
jgi:hypothetical protein